MEIKLEKNESCIIRFKSNLREDEFIEFSSLLRMGEIEVWWLSLNGFYDKPIKVQKCMSFTKVSKEELFLITNKNCFEKWEFFTEILVKAHLASQITFS